MADASIHAKVVARSWAMQEMEASGLHVVAVVGTDPLQSEWVAAVS